VELKLDLASIFLERGEVPLTRKMLKGAIHKDHIDSFWAAIDVSGTKVLIITLKVDIDFGIQDSLGLLKNFHPAAPGQEFWIARNVSY
jgi:hypothetical protein